MSQHDHPRHKLQFWPVKPGSGVQAGMLLSPRGFDDSGALAGWMRANYPRSVKYQVDIARGGGDRPMIRATFWVAFAIGYAVRAWLVPRQSFESKFFEGFGRAYLRESGKR